MSPRRPKPTFPLPSHGLTAQKVSSLLSGLCHCPTCHRHWNCHRPPRSFLIHHRAIGGRILSAKVNRFCQSTSSLAGVPQWTLATSAACASLSGPLFEHALTFLGGVLVGSALVSHATSLAGSDGSSPPSNLPFLPHRCPPTRGRRGWWPGLGPGGANFELRLPRRHNRHCFCRH